MNYGDRVQIIEGEHAGATGYISGLPIGGLPEGEVEVRLDEQYLKPGECVNVPCNEESVEVL